MSLSDWQANRWLEVHATSRAEVADLRAIVARDLQDCAIPAVSADRRLGIAYNAALQLALLALAAEGYRPARERHHERGIESLKLTVGLDAKTVGALQRYRNKRNLGSYERPGMASEIEVVELTALAASLQTTIDAWLKKQHPELL